MAGDKGTFDEAPLPSWSLVLDKIFSLIARLSGH